MPALGRPPSLRASQRQVIAYLEPELCDALKVLAERRAQTLREVLALAVNAELEAMGIAPALTPERQRQFLRVQGAAKPRGDGCDTPGRRGRKALAGWFDRRETERLRDVAAECGRTVQDIASAGGVRLLALAAQGDGAPSEADTAA